MVDFGRQSLEAPRLCASPSLARLLLHCVAMKTQADRPPSTGARRARFALIGALLFSTGAAYAEPVNHREGWAIGLMLGAPTALSLKNYLGGANAWDIGIGVGPGVRLHGDFLFGLAQLLRNKSDLSMDLYLGLGGVIGVPRGWCGTAFRPDWKCSSGSVYGAARVPMGLDLRLTRAPLTFGIELAPGVWFGEGFVGGLLDAAIFFRFLL
jgi:hypothetical protein